MFVNVDIELLLHYNPTLGGPERQWRGEILPVETLLGIVCGSPLCVEREIA